MRVFVALDIDDTIRARLEVFLDGVRGFASDARWVRPESMHVTLKFIGEKPSASVDEIKRALGGIRGHRELGGRWTRTGAWLPGDYAGREAG